MPKSAYFTRKNIGEARSYLESLGFDLSRMGSRAKTEEGRETYLLRQANAARKAEQEGIIPSQSIGRGAHQGEKAPEHKPLLIHNRPAEGRYRQQYIMFNHPISDPEREIEYLDLKALFKAAGRPSHVTVVIAGLARYSHNEECHEMVVTAHTDRGSIDAAVKQKMNGEQFAEALWFGPPGHERHLEWCEVWWIAMYETPAIPQKEGRKVA